MDLSPSDVVDEPDQSDDAGDSSRDPLPETSSSSSLTVTIGPGEAFVDGWLATDSSIDVDLTANTAGQTVGVSWDPDAVYDPDTDADRDAADRVVVALESNVSSLDPFLPLWTFGTDGSGVASVVDERAVGVTVGAAAFEDEAGNVVENLVGENLHLVDGELRGVTAPDVRSAVNDLLIQNAEQDFELGLNLLEYDDGQYEVFANDTNIASSTGLTLNLGSPLNDAGYVALTNATVGDISIDQGEYTTSAFGVNSIFVDEEYGYSAESDNTVKKWDINTLTEQNEFTGHSDRVQSVFVDGVYGYSGADDNTVKKWDIDTLTEQAEFTGHTAAVNSTFVDGEYGYSGGSGGIVKKWDIDTLTEQNEFTGHSSIVASIFVNQGFGYSGGGDNRVKKWDVETMTEQDEFTGHADRVFSVFITGGFGYSGSSDNTVKKWDVGTLTEHAEFTGHTASVESVFVNGEYGYSAANDTIKKWDVETMTERDSVSVGDTSSSIFVNEGFLYAAAGATVEKRGEGITAETSGEVQHTFEDIGFTPEEVVINDDLRQPLPANADVYYQIEDGDGNSQTITRSDIDTTVDLTGFTSASVSTTAIIERDDTTAESPQLDAWALYLRGA